MAEELDKVSVIAHSFGGRVAILLASLQQDKVEKLVLVDSAGIKPKFSLKNKLKILNYKVAKKLKEKGLIKRELINYGSEDYKALPSQMKPVFNNVINTDLTGYLKNITAPTLIVWGKKDNDTPYYMAKKINKNIKDSAIITFENAGHFCYLDNASEFQTIVSNFLK